MRACGCVSIRTCILRDKFGYGATGRERVRFWPKADIRPLTGGLMKSAIVGLAFSLGDRMTLSDLASIGSLISGLAVLASLVFLYFQLRQMNAQVRQAERNQLAAIRLGRVAERIHVNIALMEPSAADAYLKGMSGADDITSTQYSQFSAYCRCIFAAGQDGLSQSTLR